jgi:gliding motility-associated-like protein
MKKTSFVLFLILGVAAHAQESYFVTAANNNLGALYRFYPESCTIDTIAQCVGGYDIAITPSGRIFGANGDGVIEIFTGTGFYDCTFGSFLNFNDLGFIGPNGLIAVNDELLIGGTQYGGLFRVNYDAGEVTPVNGAIGACEGDIAFYAGRYYMSSGIQLVSFLYDVNSNTLSDLQIIGGISLPNLVYGLTTVGTASCNGGNTKMLAFADSSVYVVNPIDGTCTIFCPSLGSIFVNGAMSTLDAKMQPITCKLPNVFTPNGDGINDFFEPVKLLGASTTRMEIFNRWGNTVYNSDAADGFQWDGTNQSGQLCSGGTYFYQLMMEDYCGNSSAMTGFVVLEM